MKCIILLYRKTKLSKPDWSATGTTTSILATLASSETSYVSYVVVTTICFVTICVPELSNPINVMGFEAGVPATSTVDKEKTPLASWILAVVLCGTAARGPEGGVGLVALASQLVHVNPSYTPTSASSAKSSKLTPPILTNTSVPVPPPPPLLEEFDFLVLFGALVDLTVGALVDLLVGLLVDFGPLVDLSVGALEDLSVGDLVDLIEEEDEESRLSSADLKFLDRSIANVVDVVNARRRRRRSLLEVCVIVEILSVRPEK